MKRAKVLPGQDESNDEKKLIDARALDSCQLSPRAFGPQRRFGVELCVLVVNTLDVGEEILLLIAEVLSAEATEQKFGLLEGVFGHNLAKIVPETRKNRSLSRLEQQKTASFCAFLLD